MAIGLSLALDSPEHTGYVVLLLGKKQHLKEKNLSLCILLVHTSIKKKTTHSCMTEEGRVHRRKSKNLTSPAGYDTELPAQLSIYPDMAVFCLIPLPYILTALPPLYKSLLFLSRVRLLIKVYKCICSYL